MELVSQIQNNLHIIHTILFFYRNRSLLQQLYNSLHFLLKLHKIFSLETSQHNKTYKKKSKVHFEKENPIFRIVRGDLWKDAAASPGWPSRDWFPGRLQPAGLPCLQTLFPRGLRGL